MRQELNMYKFMKIRFKGIILILLISLGFPLDAYSAASKEEQERDLASKKGKIEQFKLRKKKTIVPKAKLTIEKIERQAIRVAEPPRRFKKYFTAGTDEAELESVINEEIKQLFQLLKTSKRRDLRLRLGSLYIEKARLIEYRLYEEHDQKMELFNNKKTKRKPRLNLQPIYGYVNKAVDLFETYHKQFPRDKNMDQVLFFLGVSYFKKGKLELGRKRYQTLLKRFPKSEYTDDVNFELGEYYFNKSKWKTASNYYRKIALDRKKRMYSFALYKLAWCRFKMGQLSRALANLEAVIREGVRRGLGDKSGPATGELYFAGEAMNDIILFYGQSKRSPAKAWSYFRGLLGNSDRALKALRDLAYLYLDHGNLRGVRITFKQLIEEKPSSPMVYDYQYQIIRAHTYAGSRKIFLSELKYWIVKYGPGSSWARKNRGETADKAYYLMELTVRNYALRMHKSYRKTKGQVAMRQALFAYELYNNHFKKSKEGDQMRFFFAELLFDLKKYEMAAEQYLYVVKNFPKSKYYETASLNSVLTFEKSLPTSAQTRKMVGNKLTSVPFPSSIHTFQKVAYSYTRRFPKQPNVPAILYKQASLHYEFNHHEEALAQFWNLIKKHPSSSYTEYSANLILDIYNIKKDFKGLREAATRLLKNKVIANSGSSEAIRKIVSQVALQTAQSLAKQKKYLKSARLYAQFARQNPRSPLVNTAYYNAGVNFKKSGDLLKALVLYKGILNRPPTRENKKIRKIILKEIPEMYQETGQYMKAARAFADYARIFPKDKDSPDFWFNAALMYDGFNYYTQAEKAYLEFFKRSRKKEKVQALYLLAELKKKRGQSTQAVSYYEQFLNRGSSDRKALVEAAYKIAEIKRAKRQITQSKTWYKRTVNLYQKKRAGVFYAAEARFQLVYDDTYLPFKKIRIPRAPKLQSRVVKKKLNLFNKLKEDLKQVIRFDSGYQVVASLVLIGLASEHMANAIYNSPIPKGLNRAERAQYKQGLKKTALPFKKEGIESYRISIKRARQLRNYNAKWLSKAVQRLAILDKQAEANVATKSFLRKRVLPIALYNFSGE